MFLTASNNAVWRVVTGKRTRQDDPELIDLTNRIVNNFRNQDPSNPINLLQMNSLAFTKLRKFLGMPNFLDSTEKVTDMISDEVAKGTANENGYYIEKALSERENDLAEGKKTFLSGDYGVNYISAHLMDLFFAGTETTSTTLEWVFMYLVKYPESQEKFFQEIKNVTGGNERRVGLADKVNTHFCNAFIDEVIRHSQMAVLPPSHKTMRDVEFQGKLFPKGTQVLEVLYKFMSKYHSDSIHLFRSTTATTQSTMMRPTFQSQTNSSQRDSWQRTVLTPKRSSWCSSELAREGVLES